MGELAENVRKSVVKIVDKRCNFRGTGFFIEQDHCVTCHHCICYLEEIFIEKDGTKYPAEWREDYSVMSSDFSILKVTNTGMNALDCAAELTPKVEVLVLGFTSATTENLLAGIEAKGEISTTKMPIEYKEAPVMGSNPWNKKPRVNVMVHQISCTNAGWGLSGAPVWESNRGKVVGMFMAAHGSDLHKDLSNTGYVIPIETLLNYKQKAVSSESSSINPAKVIETGNMHYHAKDFLRAIEQYDTLINDENYKIAWLNKGQALAAIGRHEEAVECYNMYLKLKQSHKDRRIVGEINEV